MAYGFTIKSGTGATVDTVSSDNVPGVLVDEFFWTWNTSTVTTKQYPNFQGANLFLNIKAAGNASSFTSGMGIEASYTVTVNNATKTITIIGNDRGFAALRSNAYVSVIGF